MISPNEDNMRVSTIVQYLPSSSSYDFRMALYLDSDGGDPTGAVKIYDSGQLHHDGGGYREFTLPTPVDLPKNTQFGLATKWDTLPFPVVYNNDYCATPNPGYTFYDNSNNEPHHEGNSLEPFLDVIPSAPTVADLA